MKKAMWFGLALVFGISLNAAASIVMRVDSANEEFYFEGSDTGNAASDEMMMEMMGMELYDLRFRTPDNYTGISSNESFVIDSSFEEAAGLNMRFTVYQFYGYMDIAYMGSEDVTALTADPSVTYDYSSWNIFHKTLLESSVGQSLALSNGSGYSAISLKSVPEPSVIALVGLTGGGILAVRRIFVM